MKKDLAIAVNCYTVWLTELKQRATLSVNPDLFVRYWKIGRNLIYMRSLAEGWSDLEFVQQVVALLPWGQSVLLFTKLKTIEERQWHAAKAI